MPLETELDPAATLKWSRRVAGPPALGSWATVYETVNSAEISKLRFIVSSVRIAGAKPVYTPAHRLFRLFSSGQREF